MTTANGFPWHMYSIAGNWSTIEMYQDGWEEDYETDDDEEEVVDITTCMSCGFESTILEDKDDCPDCGSQMYLL